MIARYQTFPGRPGDSNSYEKLHAMRLPKLAGRSFLDLGCNEGFFCGYARSKGAIDILGVDHDSEVLLRARERYPDIEFRQVDIEAFRPGRTFDLVLMSSVLHYMRDQELMLHRAMSMLAPDGLLVLELGLADEPGARWHTVRRAIDTRRFPTVDTLGEILAGYAYKVIGPSVAQAGDPVARWVVHCRHRRPVVLLLAGSPYSGKSTLARDFARSGRARVVYLDNEYGRLMRAEASDALGEEMRSIGRSYDTATGGMHIIREIFARGVASAFFAEILGSEPPPLTLIDGYIDPKYLSELVRLLERQGYVVWSAENQSVAMWHGDGDSRDDFITLDGRRHFLTDDAVQGQISSFKFCGELCTVEGWATVPSVSEPAAAFSCLHAGHRLNLAGVERFDCDVGGDRQGMGFRLLVDFGGQGEALAQCKSPAEFADAVVVLASDGRGAATRLEGQEE